MTDRDILETILSELKGLKGTVSSIQEQQQEDHLILRALEHKSEINKAEHDRIINDIAHSTGHLKGIDENIDALKEVIGRHEVDITVLKRRPV